MSFVFVGVGFMAFLAATTLAIDVGMFMTARAQAQTSADSGALAGALALYYDDYANRSANGPAVQNALSAARSNNVEIPPGAPRLTADALGAKAREHGEPGARLNLVFDADPAAPVSVSAGRDTVALLNPYSGVAVEDASQGNRTFFQTVTRLHRYIGGSSSSTRANLIDVANLLFLFIIASGIYLWLPAVWR
jgi:uncharacterized iron-regulated membrane protein